MSSRHQRGNLFHLCTAVGGPAAGDVAALRRRTRHGGALGAKRRSDNLEVPCVPLCLIAGNAIVRSILADTIT